MTKVTLCGALKCARLAQLDGVFHFPVADSVYPTKLFASEILFSM